jgi:hypothetical protein
LEDIIGKKMETNRDEAIPHKENLTILYKDFNKSCWETSSRLGKITDDADSFAEDPEEVQVIFQSFIENVKEELPELIPFELKQHFKSPIVTDLRPKQIYEDEHPSYYSPKLNKIFHEDSSQKPTLDDLQKKGAPFSGENANLDSIESIMDAMLLFIKSEKGRVLFEENQRRINELKQKFFNEFNHEKKKGIETIRTSASKFLNAIKNQVGERKIPPYIPLWMDLMAIAGKESSRYQEKLDPYFSTKDCTIIRAPTLIKRKFFKRKYSPDLRKSKIAEDEEWLNALIPASLASLLPKHIGSKQ